MIEQLFRNLPTRDLKANFGPLKENIKKIKKSFPISFVENEAIDFVVQVLKDINYISKQTGWSRKEILELLEKILR